jgi:hypothetical protein
MKNKVALEEIRSDKEFFNEYQTMKQLKSNNVIKERVEIYRDFVVNLIHYVHTTYLGKDYIKTEEDVKGHFNWAFNKVLADFEKEGVNFGETKPVRIYFFDYFKARFYEVDSIPTIKTFVGFWDDIFTLKTNKEKTRLNALIEIYKLFDTAFTSKIFSEKIS